MNTKTNPNSYTPKFKVVSFVLAEKPGFDPQFRRSFATEVTAETLTSPRIEDTINYSASPEPSFPIPNGWEARRYSFYLRGEYSQIAGGLVVVEIGGYTSHFVDADAVEGSDMVFHVNSVTMNRCVVERSPEGERVFFNQLNQNHIYVDPEYRGVLEGVKKYRVRPEDVYAGVGVSHLTSMGTDWLDMRSLLTHEPVAANRLNVIPSHYLGEITKHYKRAFLDHTFGNGQFEETLDNARGYAQESVLRHNPFFKLLAQEDGYITGTFTWDELLAIDPKLSDVTTICLSPKPYDQFESWDSDDFLTRQAWAIAIGVPALMQSLSITHLKFAATNHITLEDRKERLDEKMAFIITDVVSATHKGYEGMAAEVFKHLFERYLLPDLSVNGALGFSVQVDASLYAETIVELNLDIGSAGPRRFIVPTFADALLTPLVVTAGYESMMTDLSLILHEMENREDCSPNTIATSFK